MKITTEVQTKVIVRTATAYLDRSDWFEAPYDWPGYDPKPLVNKVKMWDDRDTVALFIESNSLVQLADRRDIPVHITRKLEAQFRQA